MGPQRNDQARNLRVFEAPNIDSKASVRPRSCILDRRRQNLQKEFLTSFKMHENSLSQKPPSNGSKSKNPTCSASAFRTMAPGSNPENDFELKKF